MPVPGTLSQFVSKSGGNAYHGSVYADFQNAGMQATNIDSALIARGLTGGPALDVHEVNRLELLHDLTMDAGGYLKKDRAWWSGAYRSTRLEQRYAWLLDTPAMFGGRRRHGQAHLPPLPLARNSSAICSTRPSISRSSSTPQPAAAVRHTGDALPQPRLSR